MATCDNILTLRISLAGCRYDVRVNEVPIFLDFTDGWPLTSSRSVNEYLRPGVNRIRTTLTPSPGHNTILVPDLPLTVGLAGRHHSAPKSADRAIASVEIFPGRQDRPLYAITAGDPTLGSVQGPPTVSGDGARSLSVSFDVMLHGAAHTWRWLESDRIASDSATRAELEAIYGRVHADLAERRTEWIAPYYRERNAEMALALFEPERDVDRENGLYEDARAEDRWLYPLQLEDAEFMVFGDGRLARLTRWDGLPIIAFVDSDGAVGHYYPMTYRKQADNWILCR